MPALSREGTLLPLSYLVKVYLKKSADVFLKRLAMKLAEKRYRPYSQTVNFVKNRFAISLGSVQRIDVYVVQKNSNR